MVPRFRFWIFALVLTPLVTFGFENPPGKPGGFTPEEARKRMELAEGFGGEVFASEPEIRQPVAACFDERGRMWVIEYLQYPNPEGLKPVEVDQYLRTVYDRVPEPPPHGPRGADRIKILEDTSGDGKADKVTTFIEGLNLASGIAVGYGGVFVAQAPYLLFYPDRDKDDVPDSDPEVLLKGFGLEDAHAVVNSLRWGPDGWLYGAQGSTVTANIRGIGFHQGIWRYHPVTKEFELFAEGGGNTWGLDFDRVGNAFGSSNGAHITFHMVQGGYYHKTFTKHGELHNPRAYGYFGPIAYEGTKHGGHVTPGGIIYKGGAFPPEFDNKFIGANLLANTVYWHHLSRDGSTFQGTHGGTFLDAHDFWFRPIALQVGPDGAVYVVDWYDKRASHLDPRDNWDKTNGRIFRVYHNEPKRLEPFDLSEWSSEDLLALRDHANNWYPETARRILAERRDESVVPQLKESLSNERNPALAMHDLWALDVSGGLDDATALKLLDHPIADVRRWTIRRLGDEGRMNDAIQERLLTLADEEPESATRSQLASSCQRWGPETALPILGRLIQRSEDVDDPHIPLLLWWALERQMHADRDGVVDLVTTTEAPQALIVREYLLERVARALTAVGTEEDFEASARLLASATDDDSLHKVITGLEKGLEGRRLSSVPEPLAPAFERLSERSEPNVTLLRFAVRIGSEQAYEDAIATVLDPSEPESKRTALLEVIGPIPQSESKEALLTLLQRDEPGAVHQAVLNALTNFDGSEIASALLDRYPDLSGALQTRILDVLCGRRAWACQLLDHLGSDKTVDPQDLKPAQVVRIAQFGDDVLIQQVEQLWGRVPGPDSPDKTQRIAEIRGVLPEGDKGDARRGLLVFRENCAGCHKLFGEGEEIGPDLTGIERNQDFLLESLINPSILIRKEYQATTVALVDGRVLDGMIVEESDSAITLFDHQQQRTVIAKDAIEAMKVSETSLMPEGILDPLTDTQVRDLFRLLQSSSPPGN